MEEKIGHPSHVPTTHLSYTGATMSEAALKTVVNTSCDISMEEWAKIYLTGRYFVTDVNVGTNFGHENFHWPDLSRDLAHVMLGIDIGFDKGHPEALKPGEKLGSLETDHVMIVYGFEGLAKNPDTGPIDITYMHTRHPPAFVPGKRTMVSNPRPHSRTYLTGVFRMPTSILSVPLARTSSMAYTDRSPYLFPPALSPLFREGSLPHPSASRGNMPRPLLFSEALKMQSVLKERAWIAQEALEVIRTGNMNEDLKKILGSRGTLNMIDHLHYFLHGTLNPESGLFFNDRCTLQDICCEKLILGGNYDSNGRLSESFLPVIVNWWKKYFFPLHPLHTQHFLVFLQSLAQAKKIDHLLSLRHHFVVERGVMIALFDLLISVAQRKYNICNRIIPHCPHSFYWNQWIIGLMGSDSIVKSSGGNVPISCSALLY